uniref:Nudix hydrolase domain-containing protein n=1 Tax=Chenopodium quinoa TaxID=63459 RepID=A0A803MJ72_CHEQI
MGSVGCCEKQGKMSELVARTGRQQQRYEDGCRLVAGCIPFRYRNSAESDGTESEKIVEVLMINSTSGPGLLFPKGGWENDETVEEAARREAIEEAGVKGDILVRNLNFVYNTLNSLLDVGALSEQPLLDVKSSIIPLQLLPLVWQSLWPFWLKDFLGYYDFKSKTLQDDFSPEGLCKAAMFALLVKEELEYWPEQSTRQRSWLTIPEALDCCRHPWMRQALEEGFIKWHASRTTGSE